MLRLIFALAPVRSARLGTCLLLLLSSALGCGGRVPEREPAEATREARNPPRGLAATLGRLADDALAEGDLDAAENRYGRLLARDPRSVRALIGLGRVALAKGDHATARSRFDTAIGGDPTAVEARIGLADLAAGDPAAVRALLERALAYVPTHPGAHARLAALTGRSQRDPRDLDGAMLEAKLHPYDPRALVEAGQRLADAKRSTEATLLLEAVLGLADLDPRAAARAIALLPTLSERWRERRVVSVSVFLDEALRRDPGWRFRQRQLWLEISEALDPLLRTRFVVTTLSPFDDAPPGTPLEHRLAMLIQRTRGGASGLFAGFTAEPTPRRQGAKRGAADYLGNHLFLRDARGESSGRVLAHEVLHVYGGVHVAEDLDSLMNPGGDSGNIDPLNAEIARSVAPRRFGPGGLERNVLPHVEIERVADALSRALRVNLAFRELGLTELLGGATLVGPGAASRVERVTLLDPHLADISSFAAFLFWASERRVEAVALLELAAQLYGRQTSDGRNAFGQAQLLRRRLKAEFGVE